MAHKTYSPKDVVVVWNGIPLTGFAEDSFLRLEWSEDVFTKHVSANGKLALTKSADETGTVEIELMATAPDNFYLGAIEKAQRLAPESVAFSNFVINDPSGNSLAVAINAFIMTRPSVDLGKDQNSKTWVFGCEKLEFATLPEWIDTSKVQSFVDSADFT